MIEYAIFEEIKNSLVVIKCVRTHKHTKRAHFNRIIISFLPKTEESTHSVTCRTRGRHSYRETDRQTQTVIQRKTDRDRDRQRQIQKDRQTERRTETDRGRDTDKQTEGHIDRDRGRERDIYRDRDRERDRETGGQIDRQILNNLYCGGFGVIFYCDLPHRRYGWQRHGDGSSPCSTTHHKQQLTVTDRPHATPRTTNSS